MWVYVDGGIMWAIAPKLSDAVVGYMLKGKVWNLERKKRWKLYLNEVFPVWSLILNWWGKLLSEVKIGI